MHRIDLQSTQLQRTTETAETPLACDHVQSASHSGITGQAGHAAMARQVMTGGTAWQGRMKQQTVQAYANEVRTGDTFVGDMVRVLSTRMQHNVASK